MMPIQRQNEGYGVFNDGMRFARDHETKDLPDGLVNMLSRGVGITAGLNDPRRMEREALGHGVGHEAPPQPGFDPFENGEGNPRDDGRNPERKQQQGPPPFNPFDVGSAGQTPPPPHVPGSPSGPPGGSPGGFNPFQGPPAASLPPSFQQGHNPFASRHAGFGAYPDTSGFGREDLPGHGGYDEHAEARGQEYGQDPHQFVPESHMFQEDPHAQEPSIGLGLGGGYDDYDPHSSENLDVHEQFDPHMASFTTAHATERGPAPKQTHTAAPAAPAADPMAGWVGHGYVPGHRVGLPWREQVIPGTVTHLEGPQVGIRWDDGQHSTEEPGDLRPL